MKNKTTVIHHSADYDGLFCREIARKFLPDAELIGWDYGDVKIPFPSEGAVYVLDLSPECFDEVPKHQERLIWIDHHKSAIEKFSKDLPGLRIDGVAACRLAWQWFTGNHNDPTVHPCDWVLPEKEAFIDRKVSEPEAVRLAGEYDIWDKRDPNAEVFQFGLRSEELDSFKWAQLLDDTVPKELEGTGNEWTTSQLITTHLLRNGIILQRYQRDADKGAMGRSFMVEFEGMKFLTLNTARFNSLTFADKDVPETGHDALLGFCWTGKEFTVSLYHANHRKDLDLSLIAVKHGGGGHRGACGFRAKTLPFVS
jgi:uncharacterized protein